MSISVLAEEVAIVLVLFWFVYCNNRTYKQRRELIEARPFGDSFWTYYREFHQVSYDRHLWYLLTFRDPMQLYGVRTQMLYRSREPGGVG